MHGPCELPLALVQRLHAYMLLAAPPGVATTAELAAMANITASIRANRHRDNWFRFIVAAWSSVGVKTASVGQTGVGWRAADALIDRRRRR